MGKFETVQINLKNVQSVKAAKIVIEIGKLNIKYGYNGIGKSSIAKAIDSSINKSDEDLLRITPFDYGNPSIEISKEFKTCMSFNREYINNWLFKGDNNLINESYSIFLTATLLNRTKIPLIII